MGNDGKLRLCGNCVHCIAIPIDGDVYTTCSKGRYTHPHPYKTAFYHQGRRRAADCPEYTEHTPMSEEELREIRGWFRVSCYG